MACSMMWHKNAIRHVSCPYRPLLSPCWLIISKVQWHSSDGVIINKSQDTNQWSKIENCIFKIASKVPMGQWVKYTLGKGKWCRHCHQIMFVPCFPFYVYICNLMVEDDILLCSCLSSSVLFMFLKVNIRTSSNLSVTAFKPYHIANCGCRSSCLTVPMLTFNQCSSVTYI